jgi:hypothetical protein
MSALSKLSSFPPCVENAYGSFFFTPVISSGTSFFAKAVTVVMLKELQITLQQHACKLLICFHDSLHP